MWDGGAFLHLGSLGDSLPVSKIHFDGQHARGGAQWGSGWRVGWLQPPPCAVAPLQSAAELPAALRPKADAPSC